MDVLDVQDINEMLPRPQVLASLPACHSPSWDVLGIAVFSSCSLA